MNLRAVRSGVPRDSRKQARPAGDRTYGVKPTTGTCDPVTVVITVREPQDPPELLLYYDFNDASDPELVRDRTEYENDSEVFGFAQYTDEGGGLSGEPGDLALDFGDPGDGSYINVLTAPDGTFEEINERDQATVTMWCFGGEQLPANTTGFRFFNDRDFIAQRILSCHIPWGNGNFYLDVADFACCNNRIQANTAPENYKGRWNHYAFVKDGPVSAIYINGEVLVDSGNSDHDSMEQYPITGIVFGGAEGGNESYHGLWDELTVWAGALSLSEIREVMENGPLPPEPETPRFTRGDANADGAFNISDGTFILNSLFAGGPDPTCGDAADANSDGGVNIADGVYVLNALFGGGDQPGSPFPDCGTAEIRVGCDSFAPCP